VQVEVTNLVTGTIDTVPRTWGFIVWCSGNRATSYIKSKCLWRDWVDGGGAVHGLFFSTQACWGKQPEGVMLMCITPQNSSYFFRVCRLDHHRRYLFFVIKKKNDRKIYILSSIIIINYHKQTIIIHYFI